MAEQKIYVWWTIASFAYSDLNEFSSQSGLDAEVRSVPLINNMTTIEVIEMQGIGEAIGLYSPEAKLGITIDSKPYSLSSQAYLVKCRNERFIVVNAHDCKDFKKIDGNIYQNDLANWFADEFADDTTEPAIFQTQDYVYWDADPGIPALIIVESTAEILEEFDTCRGVIVDRLYYGHPYSLIYFEQISDHTPLPGVNIGININYIPVNYEGWVYAIAFQLNGSYCILWTPENNLDLLDISQVYKDYLMSTNEDFIKVKISTQEQLKTKQGRCLDILLMPHLINTCFDYCLEEIESREYEYTESIF